MPPSGLAGVRLNRTKSVDDILATGADGTEGDVGRLDRRLGPVDLMGFGIGIVIGTGIFTLTGVAAKDFAGPGVTLSFALAGVVSLLAALCYAELASAVPTAGSAYTYAYATIGEIFAWIIGWDLVLEFALGAAVVARGWSGYLASLSDAVPTSLFGLLGCLGISALLYVAVSAVLTGMVDYHHVDEGAPISSAFKAVGLGWAAALISVAAICGLTSVILVDIVTMARIGFAMARDGLLPPRLARLHPRFGTPSAITLVTVAVVAVLAAFVPLAKLAEMVSIGTLFAFMVVSVAVPVLRRTRPDLPRPFRTPLSPVLPVVSALLCAALMANLAIDTWLRFVVWLVVGFIVYFGYGARNAHAARPEAVEPSRSSATVSASSGSSAETRARS